MTDEITQRWTKKIEEVAEQLPGLTIVLVDGFLLYWDKVRDLTSDGYFHAHSTQACADTYDVSLFLRVPHDMLKARREERQQYVTQSEFRLRALAALHGAKRDPDSRY